LAVTDHHLSAGGRHLFLAHATGFCSGTWGAVIDEVAGIVGSATSWDFRGHGASGGGSIPVSWWDMADDAGAVRDSVSVEGAIGVGHSMGGAALVMAQILDPGRFSGLVLVEPIIPPPPHLRAVHRLAELARKRRRTFTDRSEVRANFLGRPPFDHWRPAAFEGYVAGGFRERGDGTLELACSPEFEAEVFTAAGGAALLDRLGEVEIPVTLLFGETMDVFPREWAEHLSGSFPNASLQVVPGGDHFLPMSTPGVVVEAIRRYAV
jgi:pimeloyl-ACP methyl ester carboxylesterase